MKLLRSAKSAANMLKSSGSRSSPEKSAARCCSSAPQMVRTCEFFAAASKAARPHSPIGLRSRLSDVSDGSVGIAPATMAASAGPSNFPCRFSTVTVVSWTGMRLPTTRSETDETTTWLGRPCIRSVLPSSTQRIRTFFFLNRFPRIWTLIALPSLPFTTTQAPTAAFRGRSVRTPSLMPPKWRPTTMHLSCFEPAVAEARAAPPSMLISFMLRSISVIEAIAATASDSTTIASEDRWQSTRLSLTTQGRAREATRCFQPLMSRWKVVCSAPPSPALELASVSTLLNVSLLESKISS